MAEPDADLRRNRLLAALPDARRDELARAAEVVELGIRETVYEHGKPIDHVHFPLDGVMSLVSQFDGHTVEVATVGPEGMLGLPVFLQASYSSSQWAFCQVPARSARLPADAFTEFLTSDGELHTVLHRYTQALFTQLAQNAACNAVHDTMQRAARWVLMTDDRVAGDEFELTQEFLAQMLAVRRPAMNGVQQELQSLGCIEYSRGRIRVLDRAKLEDVACACYGIIREEHDRLSSG
jgi:CRP-like cAMP-binding protein